MKKILIITTLITLAITAFVVIQRYWQTPVKKVTSINEIKEKPDQTGGIVEPQPESEIQEGQAISRLQFLLPFSTYLFTIESFDYKTAKFLVNPKPSVSNFESEFDAWIESSEFKDIRKERFLIQ
ncbi:MAG: hypothetical protein UX13_C0004G0009 [Candidatus Woesebacteria bacterium GW2011_GWB1_45_5]|uniref:Uncharacterized protein n=1 Tax=Candidatus Woesebacteria bacterium GW2011_GWB1_45_5 TaxID=1618581 RepID=A0A0G1MRL0_9BACT|nr:MAG: hypothetical protein UX13_C0004G0009 [Candidatus Woesebacteria bacterium GW2011_GWB1_45_5]